VAARVVAASRAAVAIVVVAVAAPAAIVTAVGAAADHDTAHAYSDCFQPRCAWSQQRCAWCATRLTASCRGGPADHERS
jgi:hypothetical protein